MPRLGAWKPLLFFTEWLSCALVFCECRACMGGPMNYFLVSSAHLLQAWSPFRALLESGEPSSAVCTLLILPVGLWTSVVTLTFWLSIKLPVKSHPLKKPSPRRCNQYNPSYAALLSFHLDFAKGGRKQCSPSTLLN